MRRGLDFGKTIGGKDGGNVVLRAMAIERSEMLRRPKVLSALLDDVAAIFAPDRVANADSETSSYEASIARSLSSVSESVARTLSSLSSE